MVFRPRKTTPKVRDGKVQKKNNHEPTHTYWNTPQEIPVVDRMRPGKGCRHVLRKKDIHDFIALLPEWKELSRGLKAIVLTPHESGTYGWICDRVIALCAVERDLWSYETDKFFKEHQAVYDQIGVEYGESLEDGPGTWEVRFTEETMRAFLLVHILPHELGHLHDQMSTRSKAGTARGEGYAERYALKYGDVIWERYQAAFRRRRGRENPNGWQPLPPA
jgi:hypothetical protein